MLSTKSFVGKSFRRYKFSSPKVFVAKPIFRHTTDKGFTDKVTFYIPSFNIFQFIKVRKLKNMKRLPVVKSCYAIFTKSLPREISHYIWSRPRSPVLWARAMYFTRRKFWGDEELLFHKLMR